MQSKLLEKERQCRDLELQVHSSLRDVTASSGDLEALRKRLALSEAACKAGRSKEAQLNEVTAGGTAPSPKDTLAAARALHL